MPAAGTERFGGVGNRSGGANTPQSGANGSFGGRRCRCSALLPALLFIGASLLLTACGGGPAGVFGNDLQTATPEFDPDPGSQGGVYDTDISVRLSSSTDGATIYYTTGPSDPTTDSATFNPDEPIRVSPDTSPLTIRAFADSDGRQPSAVVIREYTVSYASLGTLEFDPGAGSSENDRIVRTDPITISISVPDTPDAEIYYNLEGRAATIDDTPYEGPFLLSRPGAVTLNAIAVKPGFAAARGTAFYNLDLGRVAEPQFRDGDGNRLAGGVYRRDISVAIAVDSADATIYYTTAATEADLQSPDPDDLGPGGTTGTQEYTEPISVEGNGTTIAVSAVATAPERDDSAVNTATFSVEWPRLTVQGDGNGTAQITDGALPDTPRAGPVDVPFDTAVEITASPSGSYAFDRWEIDSGTQSEISIADENAPTTKVTLFDTDAVLEATFAQTYELSFEANGADGTPPAATTRYPAGTEITVPDNSGPFTRADHSFAGWNTEPDGSGTGYAAGDTLTMPAGAEILYAQWNPSYSMVIDPQDPDDPSIDLNLSSNSVERGTSVDISTSYQAADYRWFLDGIEGANEITGGSDGEIDDTVRIETDQLSLGVHSVTLIVDDTYSADVVFTVVNATN